MADCPSVPGSAAPREHTIADQALPRILTNDDEHLADAVIVREVNSVAIHRNHA